jgi:hypothetical protein
MNFLNIFCLICFFTECVFTSNKFLQRHAISVLLSFPSFINGSTAFSWPWPLLQFRNHFTQTVGLLGGVISPSQDLYVHTGRHKHRINAHTDIHALSGIRNHDLSVRTSEDSSCLRPRGHCDRHFLSEF